MVTLKCSCEVTEEGKFILGKRCIETGCKECKNMQELHPFGDKRLSEL